MPLPDMPPVDMRPDQWTIVSDILHRQVPAHEVWAFGSRARGNARRYSDLDLAIISATPLPIITHAALAEAFSESDLPWRVDLVDWATTSPAFREIIRASHVVVQSGAGPTMAGPV